ncbi:MAG: glycoside hydrolase family 2 [Dysgonamonadaceae bacterium]|nr:glycoside hydrolase family 2 [Dysgonamonadaceae bacterium]
MMRFKFLMLILAVAAILPILGCKDRLADRFENPPTKQRVGCYWYWIDNKITKEGVVADLHAMKKAGITRAYIGLTGGGKDVKFMSEQWWELIHIALKTATKLDIEIGLFNSPGWSQSGGPWLKPSQSMRYLTSVQRIIKGPKKISEKLTIPAEQIPNVRQLVSGDEHYQGKPEDIQDVKVLAFPVKAANIQNYFEAVDAKITFSSNIAGKGFPVKLPPKEEASITLTLPKPVPAQGLLIKIEGSFRSQGELQAKVNGQFVTIKEISMDRTDTGLSRGFLPFSPFAVSFPQTEASEFRIVFHNTNNRSVVTGISLTEAPLIERFPEKTFAKMFNSLAPPWNAFMWETETNDESLSIDPQSVVDISDKLSADGTLSWNIPEGDWVIMRTGMLSTGMQNAPIVEGGIGPEVDKLSYPLTQYHFDSYLGEIIRRIPAADRKSWKYNIMDSYEKGGQNFTDNFIEIFKERYGYDPVPYIPAYFGFPISSPELSDRFLWDMRRLVADRIATEYAHALADRSHENGLLTWLENYGSWGFAGEFLQYGGQSDEVGGEFWTGDFIGKEEIRCATSCAHTYGKTKVWAEALTSGGGHYTWHPGNLKRRGDWSLAEGVNAFILHVYIQQHADNVYPGVDAWYNIQFNRKNTWFSLLDLYTDYIRRCGYMLQQGIDVSDVVYFIGEDAPKMCGVTNPPIPTGYHYDHINAEVLLRDAKVINKKLVLPHGTSYHVLVMPPQDNIRPEVFAKIAQFANAGLPVIATVRPVKSPSLENYPEADNQVRKIAANLWDNNKILNTTVAEFFKNDIKLPPDFVASSPALQYSHRKDGDTDIYFITNQSGNRVQDNPTFRVYGKQPELWYPVTGKHRLLPAFTQIKENGTTYVPLQLEPDESVFIVFRKQAKNVGIDGIDKNFPERKIVTEINSVWTVTFESDEIKRGPAEPVIFEQLTDWSKHSDDRIKYFSGTAVYITSFDLGKKPDGELYLDLGKVVAMAKVKINGQYAGGVWTAPYRVDVTPFVKSGKNEVEIEVVGTWANRIIGDRKLPVEQRKLHIGRGPDGDLYESGLLGPVKIVTGY